MFKRSAVVIAGAAGAGALLVAHERTPPGTLGYEGTHGPEHWGSLDPGFAVCSNGREAQRHPGGSRASAPAATRGSAALRAAGAGLRPAPRPGGPRQAKTPEQLEWFWSRRKPPLAGTPVLAGQSISR